MKELEESRNGLLQENQWLVESTSQLELQIQHLEREGFDSSTAETTKVSFSTSLASLLMLAEFLLFCHPKPKHGNVHFLSFKSNKMKTH